MNLKSSTSQVSTLSDAAITCLIAYYPDKNVASARRVLRLFSQKADNATRRVLNRILTDTLVSGRVFFNKLAEEIVGDGTDFEFPSCDGRSREEEAGG